MLLPASSVLDIGGGAYQVGITASRAGQFTMVVQYNETQRGSAVLVSVPVTSFTLSVTSGGISAAGTSRLVGCYLLLRVAGYCFRY